MFQLFAFVVLGFEFKQLRFVLQFFVRLRVEQQRERLVSNIYRDELDSIQQAQERLRTRLRLLQESCPHTNAEKKYDGSTGNWCKADDCYWIDFHCPDCDKRWRIDQ